MPSTVSSGALGDAPQSWHLNLTEKDDRFSCKKTGAEDITSKTKTSTPHLPLPLYFYIDSLSNQTAPKAHEQMLSPISYFNPLQPSLPILHPHIPLKLLRSDLW